ncbi:hypothetical protein BMS3Bbin04_01869 [bacterium BMS3Bbin04]|nr:hypothetical protein BMS3Bbin04_01869 [bacterium BMS3Bbin04]
MNRTCDFTTYQIINIEQILRKLVPFTFIDEQPSTNQRLRVFTNWRFLETNVDGVGFNAHPSRREPVNTAILAFQPDIFQVRKPLRTPG